MSEDKKDKLVPNLRFKGFTDDWMQEKLSSLYTFSNGINTSKENYGHGRKMISVMDVLSKDYLYYNNIINSVEIPTPDENNFKVENNDLVFVRSSETKEEVGWTKMYRDDNYSLYSGFVIRGKVTNDVNSFFVENSLNYKHRKQIESLANGSTRYNVSQQTLNSVKLPLPKLNEQNLISNLIEKTDYIITLEQEKVEKLKRLSNQILRMFLYKNWEITLDYNKTTHSSKKVKLNKILIESNERTTLNNEYPIISSTNDGLYLQSEYFKGQVASKNNIGYKVLQKNQIVLSPQNLWLGNINYNDKYDIGIVSPSYKIFDVKNEYDKYLIGKILGLKEMKQMYTSASEQGASVVRRNLNLEDFYNISINVPNFDTQHFVSRLIKIIDDSVYNHEERLKNYKYIRNMLLNNLFV